MNLTFHNLPAEAHPTPTDKRTYETTRAEDLHQLTTTPVLLYTFQLGGPRRLNMNIITQSYHVSAGPVLSYSYRAAVAAVEDRGWLAGWACG